MSFNRNDQAKAHEKAPEKAPERSVTSDSSVQNKAKMQIAAEKVAEADKSYVIAPGKVTMCRRGPLKGGEAITVIDCSRSMSEVDLARGKARLDTLIAEGHVVEKKA